MTRSIVALGYVDVVIHSTLKRLVERDSWAHELFLDLAKPVEARLELEVMVAVTLCNCGYDGDVITLRTHIVGR